MRAPRLLTRALVASFLTVALVLGAVFAVLSLRVRDQVRQSVADNLASAQQVFTRVDGRMQQDQRASVATLAENPTLKAALDTWQTERSGASEATSQELLATVQREADKIADRVGADVLAIADLSRRVVASGGRLSASWPRGVIIGNPAEARAPGIRAVSVGSGMYHVVTVPLQFGESAIGSLELGTALDAGYARELADLSRGQAAILSRGSILASTVSGAAARDLAAYDVSQSGARTMTLAGESWAVQPLLQLGDVTFLALASIDHAAAGQTQAALRGLAWVGLGAIGLAVIGSMWLARTLTQPIDQLSKSLSAMTGGRARDAVPLPGTSRELDQLTNTFNSLLSSLASAEAEAEATYLGAVRALAAALDARDPYTAGHSERVSMFAVAMGEELALDVDSMETLRLGALLHDIGKIGVPDEVLRKSSALTAAEFETIKTHPSAGARILRSIPFLAPHIPIVELHHERPDGLGYPYGLRGEDIPLAARIVHVADAFDAMTSARAYRSGRMPVEAIAELRRCAGTDFDGPSVEALITALPRLVAATEPAAGSRIDEQWSGRPALLRRTDKSQSCAMGAARALRLLVTVVAATLWATSALAQTSRFALDAVAAADVGHGSQIPRKATGWFDLFGAVRIADNLDVRVRPVVFRRSFDGEWRAQMYELALRYERPGPLGLRIDAGQITSPIGLSILENRPDKNPVVSPHSTLYLPIPRYEAGTPSTNLLAATYPLGAKVTVSGSKWDARAAVVDGSPIRGRQLFGNNQGPRMANVVAGIGFTPYIGLRLGAAVGAGDYADQREVRDRSRGDRRATLTQVEGEWAFRYTRIAGEFLWTRRELAATDAKVDGGWIEITQTIHPRIFLAARYDDQWTEWISVPGTAERHEPYRRLETGAGFRLTPEVILRATYMTRKGYVVGFWDDQLLASIVFAKRIK